MEIGALLLMRHELSALVLILALILAEVFIPSKKKSALVDLTVMLFAVHTVIGWMDLDSGSLFGGMFYSNAMIHFIKNILNVGVLILLLQTSDWLKRQIEVYGRGTEFIPLLLSSLVGIYFMVSSGDFLMFYLGLELSTLPLAGLAAYELLELRSTESGIKLILSAALASGISLFGISLIYASAGSLYFDVLSTAIEPSNMVILGMVLFVSGLGFKISLVPYHFWTADVYEGAPIGVASYLSVISKGAAVFVLMILLFTVMSALKMVWLPMLYALAVLTMFIGNLFALRQKNMKRFLAFSSVAQAGFILFGIIAGGSTGTATVVYFTLIYIFSNLAAFGVVQAIYNATGKETMDDYEGLYRTNPNLSLTMMLALFSLAGIPPVSGFFGKFFLFTAAAGEGFYWLVFLGVVNVTISLYYYLLVVRAMFLRKSEAAIPHFKSGLYMRIGLALTVIGILVIGIYSPVYDFIFELSANLK